MLETVTLESQTGKGVSTQRWRSSAKLAGIMSDPGRTSLNGVLPAQACNSQSIAKIVVIAATKIACGVLATFDPVHRAVRSCGGAEEASIVAPKKMENELKEKGLLRRVE